MYTALTQLGKTLLMHVPWSALGGIAHIGMAELRSRLAAVLQATVFALLLRLARPRQASGQGNSEREDLEHEDLQPADSRDPSGTQSLW